MTGRTKSSLSEARRRLVKLCQEVNFGRLEGLRVQRGEPQFQPAPRVLREHKFGAENGPRPERLAGDFCLKAQHNELFDQLDRLGSGTVELIEVKHGLPFRMVVEGAA